MCLLWLPVAPNGAKDEKGRQLGYTLPCFGHKRCHRKCCRVHGFPWMQKESGSKQLKQLHDLSWIWLHIFRDKGRFYMRRGFNPSGLHSTPPTLERWGGFCQSSVLNGMKFQCTIHSKLLQGATQNNPPCWSLPTKLQRGVPHTANPHYRQVTSIAHSYINSFISLLFNAYFYMHFFF